MFICPDVGGSKDPGKAALNIHITIANTRGKNNRLPSINCKFSCLFDKFGVIVYIYSMGNNKFILLLNLIAFLALSCVSNPAPEQTQVVSVAPVETVVQENTVPVEPSAVVVPPVTVEEEFNPYSVTQEYYDSTKDEVQHFINDLNQIIRDKNYNSWRATLSDDYFREISSQENLQQVSDQPAMRTRRIVLRTAEDYFLHVVVPSRANSRVDDIEFIGRNRVKAFTVNVNSRSGEEQRLRLYDLEKIGNTWKIIN